MLRLKIDMSSSNHALRDPIAYRIKYTPHYRTKRRYHVYPSYDYSHGIVDALEGITHSFCTMEFYERREQYYWPLRKLGIPTTTKVIEFGRLNIENAILSKRKIIALMQQKIVSDMTDPRLYTLQALRRRGFTPGILKALVSRTTTSFERHSSMLSKTIINSELRNTLVKTCMRAFAVMDPIKVTIKGLTLGGGVDCLHANHHTESRLGSHNTTLLNELYIERGDFREKDSVDYYRLAPGKTVRLRYSGFVKYVECFDDEIFVEFVEPDKPKKIKGCIHWLSRKFAVPALFEVYADLYGADHVMVNDVKMYKGFVEQFVIDSCKLGQTFQFERLGFYILDRYLNETPVFIRVIDLANSF